jgi:glucose/arabinose dehydrogenase
MRGEALLAAALLAACGGSSTNKGDGGGMHVDAPPGTPDGGNATCAFSPVAGTPPLQLEMVASGLSDPVFAVSPPGDSRLFIIEKSIGGTDGDIRVVKDGILQPTPFLTINNISPGATAVGSEQGVLGIAFHPQFATNGRFFVSYTANEGPASGNGYIDEYHASPGADVADPMRVQTIFEIDDPFSNHNGGDIAFGPDGYLYFGYGDGGSANDPNGNGQNTNVLFAKMLRLDIDHPAGGLAYGIPSDNPFVGGGGAKEIWHWGLRNPWRWSFDRQTGDMYIGDVGQGTYEEIDVVPVGVGGKNFGWNTMEGTHCFGGGTTCSMTGLTLPILDYDHSNGCAVIGGYVYRGCRMPGYQGRYFYADYCSGDQGVHSFVWSGGLPTASMDFASLGVSQSQSFASFGQDAQGEIYVCDIYGGTVYRIAPM